MKYGLVLEGGAMRGMFTAGVLDVFMDNSLKFDGIIGVSAGAVFGCNYKSHQMGRVIRYNKRFCRDKRYMSFRNLIREGNLYGVDFCYRELVEELDVFDSQTYKNDPTEFYVVCTDVRTGKPVYHRCPNGDKSDVNWMRASASMPVFSKFVRIGGYLLSDGGVSDSVPLKFFQKLGYEKNVVVLTNPESFIKKKSRLIPLFKDLLRDYPAIANAMSKRHIDYNCIIRYVREQGRLGNTVIICPPENLKMKMLENDPEKLELVYKAGRKAAQEKLDEVLKLGVKAE